MMMMMYEFDNDDKSRPMGHIGSWNNTLSPGTYFKKKYCCISWSCLLTDQLLTGSQLYNFINRNVEFEIKVPWKQETKCWVSYLLKRDIALKKCVIY